MADPAARARVGGRSDAVPLRVLVICTANVCRSPLAAAELAVGWATWRTPPAVRSAGTSAISGQPACSLAAATETSDLARELLRGHRSRQLENADLEWADLILTASRDQRGEVIHRSPAVRTRVFTLLQAARLAPVAAQSLEEANGKHRATAGAINELVAMMDHLRSAWPPPERRRGWWSHRPVDGADDIADNHGRSPALHRQTVSTVGTTAREIAAAFDVVAAPE